MNLELLKVGEKVKYKTLCEAFGVKPATGNSKPKQLKDFECYVKMEKEGTWFHILEIYDTPKERMGGRGKSEASLKALKENRHTQPRRQNNITLLDDHAELVVSNKKSTYTILIDLNDVDKIAEKSWDVNVYGYVCSSDRFMLHRFVTGVGKLNEDYSPDRIVVHHINCNPLDNRKCNLQVMTEEEHLKLHQQIKKEKKINRKDK